MRQEILERLDYCIEETTKELEALESQYKNIGYGTMAIDLTLKIERVKGELEAYNQTKLHIKYNM